MNKPGSVVSETDFMATMAQITDALQKLPLHTSSAYYSPKLSATRIGNSTSDQQIIPQHPTSLLNSQETIEPSASMIIQSSKEDHIQFSEKERNVLQMTKATSVQLIENTTKPPLVTHHSDSNNSPSSLKHHQLETTTSDTTGGYYDFSSCLQSRIDAQIVELARARSKNNKSNRSPVSNLFFFIVVNFLNAKIFIEE